MSLKTTTILKETKEASQQSYPYQQANRLQLDELDRRLATVVVECIRGIVADQESRIQKFLGDKNKAHLAKGVWYPRDYIKYLLMDDSNKKGDTRYQWLRRHSYLSHGYLDHNQFDPIPDSTSMSHSKKRHWHFIVKKECLPSEALKAAIQGLSILDCATTIQIARYKALLDVLGVEKFDHLFKGIMNIGYDDDELQPLRFFVDFTPHVKKKVILGDVGTPGNRKIQIGNVISMNGVPNYLQKHYSGMGANFNVVCSEATPGKQLFVGLGLPASGATEIEINQMMVTEFNLPPDVKMSRACDEDRKIERSNMMLTACHANDTLPINHPESYVRGFDPGSPQAFNVSLVYDLVELPIDQISMQMVKSHPCATKDRPVMTMSLSQLLSSLKG